MAVTIQQIAEEAGVSRGTVDRVLHNRGKVKPEIAQKIRDIADELGYVEKRSAALHTLSPKAFSLGVVIPSIETSSMRRVAEGAEAAREKICARGSNVHIRTLEQFDSQAQIACIRELLALGINALAIAPSSDRILCEYLAALADDGIPIVTMNGDLPECKRLCYVGTDNSRAGRVAAGLMGLLLPGGGKVLPITAHLTHYPLKQRCAAFEQEARENCPHLQTLPLQSCFNQDDFAHEILLHTIEAHPDLRGVYVAATGARGVCDALQELGLTGKVRVIAFNLSPQNREDLRRGRIDVILEQELYTQGYRPPLLLYQHVVEGQPFGQELEYTPVRAMVRQML